ncbi:MAG: hypothetical protein WAQ52_11550 [Terriglobales bacterium]
MANYDIVGSWDKLDLESKARVINSAPDEELEKWASDGDCNQRIVCISALSKRRNPSDQAARAARLQQNPFDPRNEVSEDAQYIAGRIVKHLWIIIVLLPLVLGVLFVILKNA